MTDTRHLGARIDRSAADVYAYVVDPANLPNWAPGLGTSIECVAGEWFVDSPMGRVGLTFAPANDYGVLDHTVTLPTGETFYNPLRVVPYGDGCEIVFSVRRLPGVTDDDFARDTDLVADDLSRLKGLLEP
ncbi:SRPBCC family protein [Micromonosporaceae bacterium Da 78-11]